MSVARTLSCLAAVVLLAGCTTGAPMPAESPTPTTSPNSWPSGRPPLQTTSPIPSGAAAEVSPQRWQAILDQLAEQGITGTPELVLAEAMTWPDSSLGCPTPGVSYTQALVDGLRVIVSVAGERYDFRFGTGSEPKLCQRR